MTLKTLLMIIVWIMAMDTTPIAATINTGTTATSTMLGGVGGAVAQTAPGPAALTARGREILARMARVNHDWLIAPPPEVRKIEYEFRLRTDPWKTVRYPSGGAGQPDSRRQGITYSTAIHELARHPEKFTIEQLKESSGTIEMDFSCPGGVPQAIGNGMDKYFGYASFTDEQGTLRLDAVKMIPLSLEIGESTEVYGEYTPVRPGRFVPLSIRIDRRQLHFQWVFCLYQPGAWLLDTSHYGRQEGADAVLPLVAEVRNVKINDATTTAVPAAKSHARTERQP